jgi:hypothetical protein
VHNILDVSELVLENRASDRGKISSMAEALEQLSPVPYLGFSVAFIIVVHCLHTYLDVRQLKAIQLPTPPAALAGEPDSNPRWRVYADPRWHRVQLPLSPIFVFIILD